MLVRGAGPAKMPPRMPAFSLHPAGHNKPLAGKRTIEKGLGLAEGAREAARRVRLAGPVHVGRP